MCPEVYPDLLRRRALEDMMSSIGTLHLHQYDSSPHTTSQRRAAPLLQSPAPAAIHLSSESTRDQVILCTIMVFVC